MLSNYYRHKSFLNYIGIKSDYIYNFLNRLSDKELEIESELSLFKKYLKYNDKNLPKEFLDKKDDVDKCLCNLRTEMKMFEMMGFRSHDAYIYVGMIKDIYLEDSTINWIYRLVESEISNIGKENCKKFIIKCKNKRLRVY